MLSAQENEMQSENYWTTAIESKCRPPVMCDATLIWDLNI